MTINVLFMQAASGDADINESAQLVRALLDMLWPDEGVATAAAFKASQRAAGANFSVDFAPGTAVILGDDVSAQGKYLVISDAVVNVSVPSPPGSGSRTHRAVLQVRDKLMNGAYTTYDAVPQVLADTGSGTPALPNSALHLGLIGPVVPSTPSITDSLITGGRASALLGPGRPRQVSSDSGRPANPYPSETIWRTDKLAFEVWNATRWTEYGTGKISDLTIGTVTTTTTEQVIGTFPLALEAGAPVGRTYRGFVTGNANGTTATPTFTLRVYLDSTTTGTLLYSHGVTYDAVGGVRQWNLECELQVSTAGSTGALRQNITWNQNIHATGSADPFQDTSTHTVNLTTDHTLLITGQYSASSATNNANTLAGVWERV